MITKLKPFICTSLLAVFVAVSGNAAPKLSLLQNMLPTVSVVQGGNASATVDAKNIGDGALNLQATSSAPWIVATVGAAHNCSDNSGPGCGASLASHTRQSCFYRKIHREKGTSRGQQAGEGSRAREE